MSPQVFWVFVGGTVFLVLLAFTRVPASNAENDVWEKAAYGLGIVIPPSAREIRGAYCGLPLLIVNERRGSCTYTCIRIAVSDSTVQKVGKPAGRIALPVIRTGDVGFDSQVRMSGASPDTTALLNKQTRACLGRLVCAGGRVGEGFVRLDLIGALSDVEGQLEAAVQVCVGAAGKLSLQGRSAAVTLLRNADSDPDPRVRLRNLEVFVEQFPLNLLGPERLASFPHVVFPFAESDLAPTELASLLRLARHAPECVAARALCWLLEAHPSAQVGPLIAVALQSQSEQLLIAAAHALRLNGRPPGLLEGVFEASEPRRFNSVIEGSLFELTTSASACVQMAAVVALGDFGSLAAVGPLSPLAGGLSPRRGVRREARAAIERIQCRSGTANAGALSLASTSGGELSLE